MRVISFMHELRLLLAYISHSSSLFSRSSSPVSSFISGAVLGEKLVIM
jgi:hypothetical protein